MKVTNLTKTSGELVYTRRVKSSFITVGTRHVTEIKHSGLWLWWLTPLAIINCVTLNTVESRYVKLGLLEMSVKSTFV